LGQALLETRDHRNPRVRPTCAEEADDSNIATQTFLGGAC